MCGRYAFYSPAEAVRDTFRVDARLNLQPRYNVAPTDTVAVVRQAREIDTHELAMLRWGLIPFWAKDKKIGYATINARAETVATKPAFREAFKHRHCLVPANGFYEWKKISGQKAKQPYHIVPSEGGLLAFAGLWERWGDADGDLIETFSIITTEANEVMASIHHRMPVILAADDFARWLDSNAGAEELLRPCPAEWLDVYPVSSYVGKAGNEGEDCIKRSETP